MSRRHEIGVGLLLLGATGVLAWMAVQVGALRGPGRVVTVEVVMSDAAGLSPGAVASVAGVQVGRVEALRVDFDRAVATVSLDAEAQIRADARFAVRARSVLGEKYLEITPVTREAPVLAEGAEVRIPEGQTEIDELVGTMGPLLGAVDPAAIQAVSRAITDDPQRPARMLASAEATLEHTAAVSGRLDERLDGLLDEAAGTLQSVRATSDAARPVMARLDATVERLDARIAAVPPEQLPELLDEIAAAVKDGRAVISRLDAASGKVETLLNKADAVTGDDIRRLLRQEGVLIRFREKKVE
jgi:phospholipid/cholesterol/gamma-HCH transport system substrate-binding protein